MSEKKLADRLCDAIRLIDSETTMSIVLLIYSHRDFQSSNQVLTLAGDACKHGAARAELAIIRSGATAVDGERIVAGGDARKMDTRFVELG